MISINRFINQRQSLNSGFTLIEILMVVLIVAIIVIMALLILNPSSARKKLYDSQRKRDLQAFSGLVADYELSYSKFPSGEDICYDTPVRVGDVCTCHFCGLTKDTKIFYPLLHRLYCDPEYPRYTYVYQYDCASGEPNWYKVYTKLRFDTPIGPYCNYGKSSSSSQPLEPYPDSCSTETEIPTTPSPTPPEGITPGGPTNTPGPTSPTQPTNTPIPTLPLCPDDPAPKYCIRAGCNNCGTFAECLDPLHPERCDQPVLYLYFPGCSQPCQP